MNRVFPDRLQRVDRLKNGTADERRGQTPAGKVTAHLNRLQAAAFGSGDARVKRAEHQFSRELLSIANSSNLSFLAFSFYDENTRNKH